jgi:hypothetical protein
VRLLCSMHYIFKYNSLILSFKVSIGKKIVRVPGGIYQHTIRLSGDIFSEQT